MDYIRVAEEENEQDEMELPIEEDGTMLLTTVSAQFPGACGLKYRNPESGSWRGLRMAEAKIQPPGGMWENAMYFVVYPKGSDNKRKGEESAGNPAGKTRRLEVKKNQDLVVLGLPWRTTEEELKTYFEQFGDVVFSEMRDTCKDLRNQLKNLAGKKDGHSGTKSEKASRISSERLSIRRTENTLQTLHQVTKQFYTQVETLCLVKAQHGFLNADSMASFELSVALLEKCIEHLRASCEPTRSVVVNAGQSVSGHMQERLNSFSSFACNPGPSSYRFNAERLPNGVCGDGTKTASQKRLYHSESAPPVLGGQLSSEFSDLSGPISPTNSYEDESWLEFETSPNESLASLSARIKALVSSNKWSRLHFKNGARELTRALAHILYTREELILSTITGRNGLDALDNVKLMAIREAVEKKYGQSTPEFEQLWKHCIMSLGQHCKYLRQKGGPLGTTVTSSQIPMRNHRCGDGTWATEPSEPQIIAELKME